MLKHIQSLFNYRLSLVVFSYHDNINLQEKQFVINLTNTWRLFQIKKGYLNPKVCKC